MSEISDNLSTAANNNNNKKYLIDIRRQRILEYAAQGLTQHEIAAKINCSQSLVSLDLQYLKCQAAANIKIWIDELIPFELNKAIAGYNMIIKTAWSAALDNKVDVRNKLSALELLAEAYDQKMDMMTNSQIIDNAVNKISNMKKELEEIRRRRENNKQQHASSSADYGVDNSNNNEEEEENKDDDPQAKFGYSDDGTVNGPLGHYDAKVGHIVYEPWEYELHANLVKWNEEAKQKGVRDREHKGGNRQF